MTTLSAEDVAAELRARLPGVGKKKLHKLLYYCQGHHLAAFGEPMFRQTLSAWDMGPVVGQLWRAEKDHGDTSPARAVQGEAQLNTIGYVLSRYGALTANDLERLTHAEPPWKEADVDRPPGGRVRIPNDSLERFFRTDQWRDEDESLPPDTDEARRWLAGAGDRLREAPHIPDSREELLARLRDSA